MPFPGRRRELAAVDADHRGRHAAAAGAAAGRLDGRRQGLRGWRVRVFGALGPDFGERSRLRGLGRRGEGEAARRVFPAPRRRRGRRVRAGRRCGGDARQKLRGVVQTARRAGRRGRGELSVRETLFVGNKGDEARRVSFRRRGYRRSSFTPKRLFVSRPKRTAPPGSGDNTRPLPFASKRRRSRCTPVRSATPSAGCPRPSPRP